MTRHSAARLAWSLCAIAIGLLGATFILALLLRNSDQPAGFTEWEGQVLGALGALGAPVLGLVIASRRPDNAYGWLWCGTGLSLALLRYGEAYAAFDATNPQTLPAPLVMVFLGGLGWMAWVALTPFLLLLFPTGRLPSHHWRWVSRAAGTAAAVLLLVAPFQPGDLGIAPIENPFGVHGTAGLVVQITIAAAMFVLFGTILAALASLVVRFRASAGEARLQIKWLAYGAFFLGADIVFSGFLGRDLPGIWQVVAEAGTFAVLYVAVGIAILRYRLYDIDRLISRTLSYAVLTAILAGVYFGGVLGLQSLLPIADDSPVAVAVSTLVMVALFRPLRGRIQDIVDRRFYRRRYDTERTIETFGSQLRRQMDLDALSAELLDVVGATMQPAHVSLWLRSSRSTPGQAQMWR